MKGLGHYRHNFHIILINNLLINNFNFAFEFVVICGRAHKYCIVRKKNFRGKVKLVESVQKASVYIV